MIFFLKSDDSFAEMNQIQASMLSSEQIQDLHLASIFKLCIFMTEANQIPTS